VGKNAGLSLRSAFASTDRSLAIEAQGYF
jgi:hypothetical protein